VWRFDIPIRFAFSGDHFALHTCVITYCPGIHAASSPETTSTAEATGSGLYTTSTKAGRTTEASTRITAAAICATCAAGPAGDAKTIGNYGTWRS
jgi:hypothetical protein